MVPSCKVESLKEVFTIGMLALQAFDNFVFVARQELRDVSTYIYFDDTYLERSTAENLVCLGRSTNASLS